MPRSAERPGRAARRVTVVEMQGGDQGGGGGGRHSWRDVLASQWDVWPPCREVPYLERSVRWSKLILAATICTRWARPDQRPTLALPTARRQASRGRSIAVPSHPCRQSPSLTPRGCRAVRMQGPRVVRMDRRSHLAERLKELLEPPAVEDPWQVSHEEHGLLLPPVLPFHRPRPVLLGKGRVSSSRHCKRGTRPTPPSEIYPHQRGTLSADALARSSPPQWPGGGMVAERGCRPTESSHRTCSAVF